ncbi:MAG: M28 family peptidase [Planctomycetota bacterium]|jgi:hypothetical protein
MKRIGRLLLVTLFFLQGLACCSNRGAAIRPKAFDEASAFAYLEHLCRMGPRAPGTPGAKTAREFMVRELKKWTEEVHEIPFEGREPGAGKTYTLTNIFARLHPELSPRVLLVTHWDTRLWADLDPDPKNHNTPIVGANDGGSGVAVILELCRLFAAHPPKVGVDVFFTDGEDLGRPRSRDYWQGSIHFAQGGCPVKDYKPLWAIVLDMVGDKDLKILKDPFSLKYAPELVARIWKTAEKRGYGKHFVNDVGTPIKDDQVPLYEGMKIPGVLLIDFEYGPKHKFFHTLEDTLDKCSAESLRIVGEVVAEVIYEEEGK